MAKKTKTELAPSGALPAVVVTPEWARELQPREYAFILEYLKDFNGQQAYLRAFPHLAPGSAAATACLLLKRANVSAALEAAIATKHGAGLRMRLMDEMVAIALHDPGDYFSVDEVTGDVTLKPIDQMTPQQRAAIAGIKTKKKSYGSGDDKTDETETEIKLSDKQGAIKTLLTGLGAFRSVDGGDGAPRVAIQVNITQDASKVL